MKGSKIEHRQLYVHLTTEEHAIRADELAELHGRITDLDIERKTVAKQYKTQLDELAIERDDLAQVVREHKERRDVECHWQENWGRKTMELYRMDTGELVSTREMTPEERQLTLKLIDGGVREADHE